MAGGRRSHIPRGPITWWRCKGVRPSVSTGQSMHNSAPSPPSGACSVQNSTFLTPIDKVSPVPLRNEVPGPTPPGKPPMSRRRRFAIPPGSFHPGRPAVASEYPQCSCQAICQITLGSVVCSGARWKINFDDREIPDSSATAKHLHTPRISS
jgi:hypothetical protein